MKKDSIPVLKIIIFAVIALLLLLFFLFFFTPAASITVPVKTVYESGTCRIQPSQKETAGGNFLLVQVKAENPDSAGCPYSSILVKFAGRDNTRRQYRIRINIDGGNRLYYVPLSREGTAGDIILEIPDPDGIDISIGSLALKKRIFFPLDIFLEEKLAGQDNYSSRSIDHFLIPSYALLLLSIILAAVYCILFIRPAKKRCFRKAVFIVILSIMLFFTAASIRNEFSALKSYWTSYGDDLLSGNIEDTYTGIYDFERFIAWADDILPEDGGAIVFVKGDPVYIMSEMAFNMYPRDLEFLDISGKNREDIEKDIKGLAGAHYERYSYLIVLSADDSGLVDPRYRNIARYNPGGGLLYILE
jgi:hypothetical protein